MGWKGWWRRAGWEEEKIRRGVDAEVAFHLEARVEDLVAGGMAEAEARRRAEAEFGDVATVRAELEAIDARRVGRRRRRDRWSIVLSDFRRAARSLRREPGFSLIAMVTLTLGLSGAASIFTLLDRVVLRPLPYGQSEELIRLTSLVPGVGAGVEWGLAKGEFLHFRERSHELESMGLYRLGSATVERAGGGTERLNVAEVEPGVATVLGMRALRGRLIAEKDNLDPEPRVAVVSERWLERHGGAAALSVGSQLRVDGGFVEIVGVLPASAVLPDEIEAGASAIDLWLPMWLDPGEPARNTHLYGVVARIADGSSIERAAGELSRLTDRLPETLPSAYSTAFMENTGFRTVATSLRQDVVGEVSRVLWMLLAAVGLVLAIAGANAANLFLVRSESRRRETAVRAALGASRSHLFSSFCAETLLLSMISAAVAAFVTGAAVKLVVFAAPPGLPRLESISVGYPTLALLLGLGVVVGFGLGIAPFFRRRLDIALLRGEGRAHTADRQSIPVRSGLVITQFAFALVLLACAALLLRSFLHLRFADPGIDATDVHVFSLHLPATDRHTSFERAAVFQRELSERVETLPGVEAASLSDYLPLSGPFGCTVVFSEEAPIPNGGVAPCLTVTSVGPGFFRALGIDVRGQVSDWTALQDGAGGAVVSEALARRLWPGRDPIGLTIRANNPNRPYYRVIGVASDVRGDGVDRPPVEAVYFPIVPVPGALVSGRPPLTLNLVVRTTGDSPGLVNSVRTLAAEIAPEAALGPMRAMQNFVAASTARVTFAAALLLLAAIVALTLSAVGIYGVMAFLVRQRTAEIGVRMALGASSAQVRRLILRQSLALAGLGVAIGLLGALVATRALRSLLFQVQPGDPAAMAGATLTLLAVAGLACALPAQRAARLDPAQALHPDS